MFMAATRRCSRFRKGQLSNFHEIWVSSGCEAERLQCSSDCEPLLCCLQPVARINSSFRSWKRLPVLSYVFCHHHSPHWGSLSASMSLAAPSPWSSLLWNLIRLFSLGRSKKGEKKSTFKLSFFSSNQRVKSENKNKHKPCTTKKTKQWKV